MNLAELVVFDKDIVLPMAALAGFVAGVILGRLAPKSIAVSRRSNGNRRRRKSDSGTSEIYVGNLPYEMDESQLRRTFKRFGEVAAVRVITNRNSGASKGYGFVTMSSETEAKAAIDGLNAKEIGGRRLVVSSARTFAR